MKIYPTEQRTIGAIVADKALTHGERTFLFFKDEEYSYRKLDEESNRVANALLKLGVGRGDKVVTVLPSFPEYLHIWWGIVKIGAWEVPINNNYRGATLADVINRSDAQTAIIGQGLFLERFRAIQANLSQMRQVVVAHRMQEKAPTEAERDIRFPSYTPADLLTYLPEPPGVPVHNYDPAGIAYTSGTTGPPKGAVLPHEWFIHYCQQKDLHMGTGPEDVMYNCLPMYNLTGQAETCLCALLADAQFALAESFNAETFWDDIRRYGATEFVSMGGLMSLVEKQPPKPDDAENPLKRIFLIPLPPDFQQRVEERYNVRCMESFGQTETGCVTYRSWERPRLGSAGQANAGYDVRIVDDNDNEVPPNTPGEIAVRPHHPHIMTQGYYNMPEKTAPRLRNCWWHTGDLGKMDEEGFLYFLRRKEECIRFRGFLISTTEVEKMVGSHPKVLECAAAGVPDAQGQEEDVMVWVHLKPGEELACEELMAHCERDMPYYMVPCYVRFMEGFPKTPTMRIIKSVLQQEGVTPDTWDRRKTGYRLSRE